MALTSEELEDIVTAILPTVTAGVITALNELEITPVAAHVESFLLAADAAGMRTAIALGSVDNTADASKPVSTAQAAAITAVNTFTLPKRTGRANVLASITGSGVTEANVGDGTTDARATIAAADTAATAAGTKVLIPTGTYRVASNLTIANKVHFAGGKLKPASGVTITLSKGYTTDNDADQLFDLSLGGTIVLVNQPDTYAEHWGAIADYTYPNNGTDNTAAFVAANNALQAMVAAQSYPDRVRPVLRTRPFSNFRILTPIYFGDYFDIDMKTSWFRYRGSDKTQAIIKIGGPTRYSYWADYHLNVDGVATDLRVSPAQARTFAAIRLTNCANVTLKGSVQNAAIGVQLFPEVGGLVSTCELKGLHLTTVKMGIQIRGNTSFGYVNENVIDRCDFTYSAAPTLGSTCGIEFSAEPGGYPGGNNNRVDNNCFQVGAYNAAMNITIGKTVEAGYYYITRSNNNEYYCSATGTGVVATVPTHTSGTVTDANGVALEYVGPFFCVPIIHDGVGSLTKGIGNRWESGDGPFVWCKNTDASTCLENHYEVYMRDGNARAWPTVDHTTGRTLNSPVAESAKVYVYGQPETTPIVVNDFHKRFIKSASGACIKGCAWYREGGADQLKQYCTGNSKLLRESVYYDSLSEAQWTWFGTFVDLSHFAGFNVAGHNKSGVYLGNIFVIFFDDKFVRIPISGTSDVSVALGSGVFYDAGDAFQITQLIGSFRRTNSTAKYAFLGFGFNGTQFTGVSLNPTWDGQTYNGYDFGMLHHQPYHQASVLTPYEPDANAGERFSHGTPTVGYFDCKGERITNIDTDPGQPVCWYVKTAGILAPAWAGTTAGIRKDELRSNGGNVYYASSAGTTGSTAPTGTTTSNDGSIVWTYLGTVAVLQASSELFA